MAEAVGVVVVVGGVEGELLPQGGVFAEGQQRREDTVSLSYPFMGWVRIRQQGSDLSPTGI